MLRPHLTLRRLAPALLAALATAPACNGDHEAITTPSTLSLALPSALGEARRPPVEFPHGEHTRVLQQEGCKACHTVDPQRGLQLSFIPETRRGDADSLMEAFHEKCMGCHDSRHKAGKESGPLGCGDCHVALPERPSARLPMAFDYSLHQRHSKAEADKCEVCHHTYDEQKKKLVYKKGTESACRDCHGAADDGKKLSLRHASHADCVGCHLSSKVQGKKHGPVLCDGCHDAAERAKIEQLKDVPRIKREQPDLTWIHTAGAKTNLVPFNHQNHEPVGESCSSCHHQTLKGCKSCHSLTGKAEGKGVMLETAYHLQASEHSCVGCHQQRTETTDCAGCHRRMQHLPGQRSCVVCHRGPTPPAEVDGAAPAVMPASMPAELFEAAALAPLPATSPDFPDKIVIDSLAKKYAPSTFPHQKIVAALDRKVRDSKLATRFHGQTGVLCAGCHHHSPVGTRPPPCKACHGDEAAATEDKPGLKVAYHRQCVGCHQEMKLKQQGCTDCHQEAKEVSP